MKLHHFTARDLLPSIARHGLWKGDVPIGPSRGRNAVSLTSLDSAEGHGLEGSGLNKKAIRLSVDVDPKDERLQRWTKFRNLHFTNSKKDREFLYCIEHGYRPETWYLYRGVIEPARLALFDMESQQWARLADYADKPCPPQTRRSSSGGIL